MFTFAKHTLLVIAPHPDDEVIGCGGLIAKVKDNGGKVYVLFLAVGDTKDFSKKGISTGKERLKEIEKVAKFLEYDNYDLAFAGNDNHLKLDKLGQKKLMDMIERKSSVSIEKIKPTIIAFPSHSSYNQDHRIVSVATHAALRPASETHKHFVRIVLSYEEAADFWTFQNQREPNTLVLLNRNEVDIKLRALDLYKSQIRLAPNLRAKETLNALAVVRGAQAGTHFAEGFTSYRILL